MATTLIALLIALTLVLNVVATVDINETGILQGKQKTYWLLVVWLIPIIGFLLFQIFKPKLYGSLPEEQSNYSREDAAGDAMEALLDLPDLD
jgi:sorbitol-specific phosphotransferase system component IIC